MTAPAPEYVAAAQRLLRDIPSMDFDAVDIAVAAALEEAAVSGKRLLEALKDEKRNQLRAAREASDGPQRQSRHDHTAHVLREIIEEAGR